MSEMKKRLQRKGARKGFTLVELLIVIIIIGILAGAMMLVAGTSRDSAEASRIISDLRNMKAAALMWMADNAATVTGDDWAALDTGQTNIDQLNKYLDRPLVDGAHPYQFVVQTFTDNTDPAHTLGEAWLLGMSLENVREGVKSNLEKQAKSAGLFGGNATGIKSSDTWPLEASQYYTAATDTYVWVVVQ